MSPKAFQLLEILVASRPKALSKLALQDQLWPDTFVVEKNLVNLVAEIRTALGDDSAHPRFVRTVHRFGYAFRDLSSETSARRTLIDRESACLRLFWAAGRADLEEGEHLLGRDPDLALFIDSPSVSRRHAVIRIAGNEATIEDLGSKNGTFLRDERLDSPVRLADGDRVRVGSVELTFRALRTPGSTQTEPGAKV